MIWEKMKTTTLPEIQDSVSSSACPQTCCRQLDDVWLINKDFAWTCLDKSFAAQPWQN